VLMTTVLPLPGAALKDRMNCATVGVEIIVTVFVPLLTTRFPAFGMAPLKVPVWEAGVGVLAVTVKVAGTAGLESVTVWPPEALFADTVPVSPAAIAEPV